jgi:hypothetical protein
MERNPLEQVLIFDDVTSQIIEVDFRGTPEEVLERITPSHERSAPEPEARRPGRPKLGVVAREVTLLPRHWDWLASQPGGASVALRKLVEQARRANRGGDLQRRALEAAYRFLSAMAGNEAGFEEATRALFAGSQAEFEKNSASWPPDLRDHAKRMAAAAFAQGNPD